MDSGNVFGFTHLQLLQGETTAGTQLGVVADGGAADHRAQGTAGWAGEDGLSLLDAVRMPADLAGRLVEPGLHMPLPPLVVVLIRNHIVTLTHLGGLDWLQRRRKHNNNNNVFL